MIDLTNLLAQADAAVEHSPGFVHYLPVATTVISAAFVAVLLHRASKRSWAPHLLWWAVGVFFYGVGTAVESTITIAGNTVFLNRLWYWAGAILGAYPLATGSLYLLAPRRVAHVIAGTSLLYVLFASYMVWTVDMDPSKLQPHRPSGDLIMVDWIRLLSIPINALYSVGFLIGGAIFSSTKYFLKGDQPKRAIGTALIAFGAILPGVGGSMARAGHVEYLYIGELVGMIFIWIGYEFCIRSSAPKIDTPQPAAD